jgi:hypothetical protein
MAGNLNAAYMTHHAISLLNLTGDDLNKMEGIQNAYMDTAAESFALAVMQGIIVICARKIRKQNQQATN